MLVQQAAGALAPRALSQGPRRSGLGGDRSPLFLLGSCPGVQLLNVLDLCRSCLLLGGKRRPQSGTGVDFWWAFVGARSRCTAHQLPYPSGLGATFPSNCNWSSSSPTDLRVPPHLHPPSHPTSHQHRLPGFSPTTNTRLLSSISTNPRSLLAFSIFHSANYFGFEIFPANCVLWRSPRNRNGRGQKDTDVSPVRLHSRSIKLLQSVPLSIV